MKKVVIIGAGPAGLVAAAYLLKENIDVTILEKAIFPRVIVGESLLPLSMEHYEEAGFLEPLKAAGFAIKPGARFVKGEKSVDFDFSEQFTDGWTWTWQVPRAEFDQIMADEVMKMGGRIEFGATILTVETEPDPMVKYRIADKEIECRADMVIDASGFSCVLADKLDLKVTKDQYPHWAVFTHVEDVNKKEYEHSERIIFDVVDQDLWIWAIPFSNGITSLGVAGHKRHFAEEVENEEEYFWGLIEQSEIFRDRFKNVKMQFEPKWHRGYSLSTDHLHGKNWVLCGNCVEFLDPIFSSGVALATNSASVAAKLVIRQLNGEAVDWDVEYDQHIKKGIDVFRTYVDGWYDGKLQDVFFSANLNKEFKAQICSVLCGYVHDIDNPFVSKHKTGLDALHKVLMIMDRSD